ncbi:hypothetical protein AgCh_027474 [Apium graveolens]
MEMDMEIEMDRKGEKEGRRDDQIIQASGDTRKRGKEEGPERGRAHAPRESGTTSTNRNRGRAAVMTYLEGLADQMNKINARMSRVERSSVQNAKRKAHRLKVFQRSWKGKGPQKRLIHDFDDAETETKHKKEASHEEDDITQDQAERGSQISKRSGQKPASSEARSTSVLDRVGKKLSEHDLRLKLENLKKEREEKEPIDQRTSKRERAATPPERHQCTSPRREERLRRIDNHEEESQVRAGGRGRHEQPQDSYHSSNANGDRKKEVVRVGDLRRILNQMEQEKSGPLPSTTPSPFTTVIRSSPRPRVFRHNPDLLFNGEADPAEYLIQFNTEMEVYQSTLHNSPPVTTLANINQREGEPLTEYFRRFNNEVPKVRGASEETIKNFLIARLKEGSKFWKSLQASEPRTLTEFYEQAEPFKRVEKQGKLTEWVVKEVLKHRTDYYTVPPPPPEDKERIPRAGSIHIILGGSHIGGDNRKTMDRYAQEAKDKPLTNVNHLSQRPPELFEREVDDILFRENDAKWVHYPHTDALVIKIKIGTVNVHRAMVDTGSSADVLTYDAYKKLGLLDRELTTTGGHLYGFTGNSIGVKGTIRLLVTMGEEPYVATQIAMFTVVDQPCAYNVIVGRPLMRAMRMVTSIHHLTVKFPTPTGVGFLKSFQYESRVCYNQALRVAESENASKKTVEPGEGDVLMEEAKGRKRVRPEGHKTCNLISIEELPENYFKHMGIHVETRLGALLMEAYQPIMLIQEEVVEEASDEKESPEQIAVRLRKGKCAHEETTTTMDLPNRITRTVTTTSERFINPARARGYGRSNDPSKVLIIGFNLSPDLREDLARFLRRNLDVFTWSHSDMIGIDPNVMCHRLNLDPKKKGVRQKRRPISGERAEALREEVDRLMEAGLVRESFYPM